MVDNILDSFNIGDHGQQGETSWYIDENGDLCGCGSNVYGQQGSGSTSPSIVKTFTKRAEHVKYVCYSDKTTWYITEDGDLYGCGFGWEGQQGSGNEEEESVPTFTKRAENVAKVVCDDSVTWYLTEDGDLYGCGDSSSGQQGITSTSYVLSFTKRAENVKDVSCTSSSTWYITEDGDLYGCGANSNGGQGSGTSGSGTHVRAFTKRAENVAYVQAGYNITWYITTSGDLYGCGANFNGNQGNGTSGSGTHVTTFTKRGENVAWVDGSSGQTWYITTSGDLYGCGSDYSGSQGTGTSGSAILTFTKRAENVAFVRNYDMVTWYITTSGDLYGCGLGDRGQQGSGDNENVSTFTKRGENVEYIGGTYTLTRYVTTSGDLYSCGDNSYGQQGSGNEYEVNTFTKRAENVKVVEKEVSNEAIVDVLTDLNLEGSELKNGVIQNLQTAPQNPLAGQFYFNTAVSKAYIFDGTNWINAMAVGDYTFQNGIEELTGADAGKVQLKLATGANAGNIDITVDSNGVKADVDEASTSAKGIIEIATDSEVATGTSETLAVNAKQLHDATADKIELTDLSIASASSNYLTYDNTTGQLGANVDTVPTVGSTNLITSGGVASILDSLLTDGVSYRGAWQAQGQTDYSSITLPVKEGYLYYVSNGTDVVIDGVTWNQGDFLFIVNDVAAGGTITSADVQKIDNTESIDIVRLNAAQTLTNKTIDGDDNTITDLGFSSIKSADVVNSTTGIAPVSTASDSKFVTEKAVATDVDETVEVDTVRNTALTASGGVAIWEFANSLGTVDVLVTIKEVATGSIILTQTIVTASTITVKINTTSNIAANTYEAIVIGKDYI